MIHDPINHEGSSPAEWHLLFCPKRAGELASRRCFGNAMTNLPFDLSRRACGSLQGGTPMPLRIGPGPVFIHESIAATRRWQLYAVRSLFVFGLLLALALVLGVVLGVAGQPAGSYSIRALASLGENFYYAIATVQLAAVL